MRNSTLASFAVLFFACHNTPKAPAAPKTFTLTVIVAGQGSVSSFPIGIDCGATCTKTFNAGDSVALYAAAASQNGLLSWSQSGCTTAECIVAMNADTTVTATFGHDDGLTVALAGAGHGSVASADGSIACQETAGACVTHAPDGQVITLTATADPGFFFVGWRGVCNGTSACAVTMASGGSAVQAIFSAIVFWSSDNDYWSVGLSGQNPQLLLPAQNVSYTGRAVLSRDGSAMAFTSQQDPSGIDATVAVDNLWYLDFVSHRLTALTSNQSAAMSASVAISADGKKIAFLSNRATSGAEAPLTPSDNLWVINSDGTGAKALTSYSVAGKNIVAFSFSPDGSQIAFFVNDPGSDDDVWVAATDGSTSVDLTGFNEQLSAGVDASWSPDGTSVVFSHDNDLYSVRTVGAPTVTDLTHFSTSHGAGAVTWSADSKTIYFQSSEDPSNEAANLGHNVWSLSMAPPYTRQVLTPGAASSLYFQFPELAPDGQTLTCESNASLTNATAAGPTFNVWQIGATLTPITSSTTVANEQPQDADQ